MEKIDFSQAFLEDWKFGNFNPGQNEKLFTGFATMN
jgi:hypothetical protein